MRITHLSFRFGSAGLLSFGFLLAPIFAQANERTTAERDVAAMVELCAVAAQKQAQGLKEGEATNTGFLPHGAVGREKFGEAQRIYHAVLRILQGMDEADRTRWRTTLSRVCSQVGWFVYMTQANEGLQVDGAELIHQAHELDAQNPVVLYQLGKIKMDRRTPDAEAAMLHSCSEAVRLDPNFPKAWIQLSLYHGRNGNKTAWKEAGDKFLATLAGYKPELYYFDTAYPPANVHILMEGSGEVERKIYYPEGRRFIIGVKAP